jgi:Bax protein
MKYIFLVLIITTTSFATVEQKKKHFLDIFVPAITKVYNELDNEYKIVKYNIKHSKNLPQITILMKKYKVTTKKELLKKLKPHPKSIALAQAALESGWATSRLFKKANNVFGVWSSNKNEPRIPALLKRGKRTIYLKKFATIEDSIRHYYKLLATGRAYRTFRNERMNTNNVYKLVKKLNHYSELGNEYTRRVGIVIRHNHFVKYD